MVFARELVKQGFVVEVLTGFPNYPTGKIYSGYRVKLLQREWIDGVLVTRVPLYPSHDKSTKKRALNYVSFAASSLFYGLFCAKRPDVIYAYHPPLTVGIVAALAEAVVVLALDIVVVVPDIVAAVESGQNNAAEVVELEVDRVVVAVIDPDIVVVAVVSVLDIAVAKDVVVDSIGAVAGTVAMGTAEQ